MASNAFSNFKNYAELLESETGIKYDAKPYKETIRKMLDGFCKAMDDGDEHLKNLYISGLMLRHWDKVKKLADSCPNIGLSGDDFADWVYEAIMYACKYRKWQTDPTVNAQQCINMCIETIRKQHYYEYNLDKHSANYNTVSLDQPVGDEDDNAQKALIDTIADEDSADEAKLTDEFSSVRDLIQRFITKQKIVEAIVLDIIAFGDTQKTTKHVKTGINVEGEEYKYTTYTHEFWKFRAIQLLSNLTEDYQKYFIKNYVVNLNALTAALEVLRKANNQKLYKELNAALRHAKSSLMI